MAGQGRGQGLRGGRSPAARAGTGGLGGSLHAPATALGVQVDVPLLFICSLTARCVPGSRLDSVLRDGLSLGVRDAVNHPRP